MPRIIHLRILEISGDPENPIGVQARTKIKGSRNLVTVVGIAAPTVEEAQGSTLLDLYKLFPGGFTLKRITYGKIKRGVDGVLGNVEI